MGLKYLASVFVLVFSLLFLLACGGSKQTSNTNYDGYQDDEYDEIERLLGIPSDDQQDDVNSSGSSDDELLQLLQSEDTATSDPVFEEQEPVNDTQMNELKSEVSDLQSEVQRKEQENAELKSELMLMREQAANSSPAVSQPVHSFSGQAGISDSEFTYQYDQGYSLFQNRQYRDAINVFEGLLASSSSHSLSDNAQYWIGEAEYMLGNTSAAIMAFEKVFTFSNSNKNEDAQFKLGLCYFKLKDFERSRQEFRSLLDNYQDTRHLSRVQDYLSRLN